MKENGVRYFLLLLFFTFVINLCFPGLSVRTEGMALPDSSSSAISFHDLAGHWAEKTITAWTMRELSGGYPDGTFRTDNPITRAEFAALVNRAFGFSNMAVHLVGTVPGQATGSMTYSDVAETDWYAGEIARAALVGYLSGYPDGTVKPQSPITRQEAAAVLSRILPSDVDANGNGIIKNVLFTDKAQIPEWSQAAIAEVVNGGYMSGYPDGTFQPTKPITRAEAISVLARAVGTLYNRAGTYGPVQGKATLEGNVTITTPGVTLQNTNIIGNLYLTEGIEEGDVTMKNVTVQGATKIGGGGSDSIHLRDSKIGNVLVNVPSRKLVRILVRGKTMVGTIEARTPVRLEEEELTGSGFTVLRIRSVSLWADAMVPVELSGQLDRVEIEPAQLPQSTQSVGTILNLSAQSVVDEIIANAPATVQGQGTVQTLWANVDGVVVEAQVKNVHPAPGVQTMVNGIIITEDYQYIESKKKKSKDASLSDITINGTTISDFAVDTLSY